jgi:hypothetical protein
VNASEDGVWSGLLVPVSKSVCPAGKKQITGNLLNGRFTALLIDGWENHREIYGQVDSNGLYVSNEFRWPYLVNGWQDTAQFRANHVVGIFTDNTFQGIVFDKYRTNEVLEFPEIYHQYGWAVEERNTSTQIATVTQPTVPAAQSKDWTPPTINIASNITVDTDSPTIKGTVSDDDKVLQVTVEGRAVDISSNGSFTFTRYVPATGSQVTIGAVDEWGNKSTKLVTITREITQTVATRFDPLDPTTFSARSNPDAVALIIGIANYKRTAEAKYADRDADYFADYARRKLGVPSSNIKVLTNDTAGMFDIIEATNVWLPLVVKAGASDVYVFFAGHGFGSDDGNDIYLLPYNGIPQVLERTALQRTEFFDTIASTQPRSATVFLDTCYSGTSRTEEVLLASRGITITPKTQSIPLDFTVFSAAGMKQTAKMLDEAEHGLFSYWLMKGMEGDADGNKDQQITAGELQEYVLANVSRLQRNQTPELMGDAERVLVAW